ncbi:MAG: xanthine dehydrogenase family protein subunit M [Anaerolineae bacterium]|nr:xanthine dehydrogenase family protein subunit M [Anaerolineae bacterium]
MELANPGLPNFDYVRATTPAEVIGLLLQHPDDARLFMGGTDVFVRMRDGAMTPKLLIDVKRLPGLTEITYDPETGLHIGAAANMNAIARHPVVLEHYPLLVESVNAVASYPLRTRATMGGNLCNASPCADTALAALLLEAMLVAAGPDGDRAIPAGAFFLGPGKHALKPGEFLTRIEIPTPPAGWAGRFIKLGRNAHGDLAIASAAAGGYPDESAPSGYRFRVALGSVAPTPIRVPEAEAILAQGPINEKTCDAAADAARAAARPIDDVRASAKYRKAMVKTLTRRALVEVWAMLQKEG